jgi:hypothetical protein
VGSSHRIVAAEARTGPQADEGCSPLPLGPSGRHFHTVVAAREVSAAGSPGPGSHQEPDGGGMSSGVTWSAFRMPLGNGRGSSQQSTHLRARQRRYESVLPHKQAPQWRHPPLPGIQSLHRVCARYADRPSHTKWRCMPTVQGLFVPRLREPAVKGCTTATSAL